MRKLNLSERRDSFKKQEAVQEVSFDEPDDRAAQIPAQSAKQMLGETQSEEECMARRNPLVPQIAVQGSESEEADDWRLCSDEDEEEIEENVSHTLSQAEPQAECAAKDTQRSSATTHEAGETTADAAKPEKRQSPGKKRIEREIE